MPLLDRAPQDDPPTRLTLHLDTTTLALLRSAAAGRALHPSLTGPAGQRARRRLVEAGAIDEALHLTSSAAALLAPILVSSRVVGAHRVGSEAHHHQIWFSDTGATVAEPDFSGSVTLSSFDRACFGTSLLHWLDVRPLPEPSERGPVRASAADLVALTRALLAAEHPRAARLATEAATSDARSLMARLVLGDARAWVVTTRPTRASDHGTWCAAVDSGGDGWRFATGDATTYQQQVRLEPVGVTEIYVALARII